MHLQPYKFYLDSTLSPLRPSKCSISWLMGYCTCLNPMQVSVKAEKFALFLWGLEMLMRPKVCPLKRLMAM